MSIWEKGHEVKIAKARNDKSLNGQQNVYKQST